MLSCLYSLPIPDWAGAVADDQDELAVVTYLAARLGVGDNLPVWGLDGELRFRGDPTLGASVAIPRRPDDPAGPRLGRTDLLAALDRLGWRGILVHTTGSTVAVAVDWVEAAAAWDAAADDARRRSRRRRNPDAQDDGQVEGWTAPGNVHSRLLVPPCFPDPTPGPRPRRTRPRTRRTPDV